MHITYTHRHTNVHNYANMHILYEQTHKPDWYTRGGYALHVLGTSGALRIIKLTGQAVYGVCGGHTSVDLPPRDFQTPQLN